MKTQLLPQAGLRARPVVSLNDDITLARGRVHEVAGPARRTFAAMLAGVVQKATPREKRGPVMWIVLSWAPERFHPEGLLQFADPGDFLFVTPTRPVDLLWTMEEALRSGQVPLVVADLPEPPGLTPIRRLHLAAEESGKAPLGLVLTQGSGGAPGVETRWYMAQHHAEHRTEWRLERRRARTLPVQGWMLRHERGQFRTQRLSVPDQR